MTQLATYFFLYVIATDMPIIIYETFMLLAMWATLKLQVVYFGLRLDFWVI